MTDSRATAPVPDPGDEPTGSPAGPEPEPDVLLDVPELTVDEIRLVVDGLDADLSLRARLANLLQLDAGVRVHLEGVELDITGVSAEALLKVRLEKLVQILDRALTTIDRNPQLIDALARSAGVTLDDVHRLAAPVVDQTGRTVAAAGEVVERTGPAVADRAAPAVADRTGPAVSGPIEAPEPPRRPARTEPPPPSRPGSSSAPGTAGGSSRRSSPERTEPPPGSGRAEPSPASVAGREGKPESERAAGSGQGAGAGPSAERPAEKKRGSERSGQPASAAAEAAQLAGQAGQALRQAGRSVWEAIQGSPTQNRRPPQT
ncbi:MULTISPECIES: hypothetical protein [unclassified Micromonospora]|uniref:hypothetical protein n=1 Tax=unclassified Micromonospora TaxID=2617518 RepID=UPI00188EF82F|nr:MULTISPECIES: hypothetical protein [unclassified Micromonospora]MBF5032490.1 hypothetical protein [Micromonospora sp. ANENR4]MCZ7478572.1 hypothetical protein [Micromonospora sp. WMMC273]WBC03258.1 hypothetical protein O7546_29930 [Micromonospora sp. WMMA1976]